MLTAASLTTVGALPASAAPKDGCGAGRAGWEKLTIEEVAAHIALDDAAYEAFLLEVLPGHDKNGDGDLCMAVRQEVMPPSSPFFESAWTLVVDNNAQASARR